MSEKIFVDMLAPLVVQFGVVCDGLNNSHTKENRFWLHSMQLGVGIKMSPRKHLETLSLLFELQYGKQILEGQEFSNFTSVL